MSNLEGQLLAALIELETAARMRSADGARPSLLPIFARIEALTAQLPADSDPELRHFLQRKSYEKARQRLQGAGAQRGSCGG